MACKTWEISGEKIKIPNAFCLYHLLEILSPQLRCILKLGLSNGCRQQQNLASMTLNFPSI